MGRPHQLYLHPLGIRAKGIGQHPIRCLERKEIKGKGIVPRWTPIVVTLHLPRYGLPTTKRIGPTKYRLIPPPCLRSEGDHPLLYDEEVGVSHPRHLLSHHLRQ